MATYRKATTKTPNRHATGSDEERQAERLARSLGESAQQVWWAGIGALGRAQAEGTRLFETLVEEGEQLERRTRESAGHRAGEVIQAVGHSVDGARAKVGDTWDRWERAFDERLQRALSRLGIPHRDDLAELKRQVEELTVELRRQRTVRPRRTTAKRPAAKTAAATAGPAPLPAGETTAENPSTDIPPGRTAPGQGG